MNKCTFLKKYLQVGERLRELRETKTGLSQEEFSKKLGISLRGYQNYETGSRMAHPHTLTRIAEMCDTTTDWILTGELNIEKARMVERAKSAGYLEEIVERLEETIKREEKLLYLGVQERSIIYGHERIEEKEFVEKLKGYINDVKVDFLSIERRKLIEAMVKILDSKNEKAIEALTANIWAFLEMVTISKNNNEDKGGDSL